METAASVATNLDDDAEDYYLAPQSQRAFGAGIKRKRVLFVPATADDDLTESGSAPQSQTKNDVAARYLSIVLGQTQKTEEQSSTTSATSTSANIPLSNPYPEPGQEQETVPEQEEERVTPCPICSHPTTPSTLKAHESSITHQLSLEHSHPPSHLDRSRKGLKYLEGYGWDPDARVGLGARSEGIRVPVRAREKRDTTGLGLWSGRGDDEDHSVRKMKEEKRRNGAEEGEGGKDGGTVVRLNAKQVRRVEEEKRKRAEKLRGAFYGEDLSQYLGDGG